MKMRVMVCEISDEPGSFEDQWNRLAREIKTSGSHLVLLPEMGLSPWFAWRNRYEPAVWNQAVLDHDSMIERFKELAPAVVMGSRPVNLKNKRLNEAFVWDVKTGYHAAHHKYYLPNERGYRESSWYERGDGDFKSIRAGDALVGFAICSELWFFHRAREYGQQGVHIVACPRATPESKYFRWIAGGQAQAVVVGAYAISSCKTNKKKDNVDLGGHAWIIDPDGRVLGETSQEKPFLTMEVDLHLAEESKKGYPRYIPD